jgi:hypothetical protein
VIDVWDAMSVNRPYRRAVPQAAILEYIARSSCTLFDPDVVDAFLAWRKKDGVCLSPNPVYPVESDLEMRSVLWE